MIKCKKTGYASRQFALDDIIRIQKRSKRDKVPVNAYLCKICNLWHLTSSKDWKEELNLKQLKIASLEKITSDLNDEIKSLKAQIEDLKVSTNKEDRVAVKADERVKLANKRVKDANRLVEKLRKEQGDLIHKNIQLQKKLDSSMANTTMKKIEVTTFVVKKRDQKVNEQGFLSEYEIVYELPEKNELYSLVGIKAGQNVIINTGAFARPGHYPKAFPCYDCISLDPYIMEVDSEKRPIKVAELLLLKDHGKND